MLTQKILMLDRLNKSNYAGSLSYDNIPPEWKPNRKWGGKWEISLRRFCLFQIWQGLHFVGCQLTRHGFPTQRPQVYRSRMGRILL